MPRRFGATGPDPRLVNCRGDTPKLSRSAVTSYMHSAACPWRSWLETDGPLQNKKLVEAGIHYSIGMPPVTGISAPEM